MVEYRKEQRHKPELLVAWSCRNIGQLYSWSEFKTPFVLKAENFGLPFVLCLQLNLKRTMTLQITALVKVVMFEMTHFNSTTEPDWKRKICCKCWQSLFSNTCYDTPKEYNSVKTVDKSTHFRKVIFVFSLRAVAQHDKVRWQNLMLKLFFLYGYFLSC